MALVFVGELGKPPSSHTFVLRYFRDLELTIWLFGSHMRIDNETANPAHLFHELTGFIYMVEDSAAEDRIENPGILQISHIPTNETQMGKIGRLGKMVAALTR